MAQMFFAAPGKYDDTDDVDQGVKPHNQRQSNVYRPPGVVGALFNSNGIRLCWYKPLFVAMAILSISIMFNSICQ